MKWLTFICLIFATLARAADPATQPATTQPAKTVVFIVPFVTLGEANKYAWISQGVQQSLAADFARSRAVQAIAVNVGDGGDVNVVRKGANDAKAQFAVMGNIQVIDTDLRITAQVVEAGTGNVMGGLKATGTLRDLFEIEDRLAAQLRKIVVPPTAPAAGADQGAVAIAPSGPLTSRYPWEQDISDPALRKVADEYRYGTTVYYPYGYGSGLGYGFSYYPGYRWGWGRFYPYGGYGAYYGYPVVPVYSAPIVNIRVSPGIPNGIQQALPGVPNPVPVPGGMK